MDKSLYIRNDKAHSGWAIYNCSIDGAKKAVFADADIYGDIGELYPADILFSPGTLNEGGLTDAVERIAREEDFAARGGGKKQKAKSPQERIKIISVIPMGSGSAALSYCYGAPLYKPAIESGIEALESVTERLADALIKSSKKFGRAEGEEGYDTKTLDDALKSRMPNLFFCVNEQRSLGIKNYESRSRKEKGGNDHE